MNRIYEDFCENKKYEPDLQDCIRTTVDKLLNNDTSVQKPGMLLGKIQSGKTRTFIGIIALCFDEGYGISVVLTKGTKALAKQTYERLYSEFEEFIDHDDMKVYDIMNIPSELTPYIRSQKLIIVVKKETNNLDRLVGLFEKYEDLRDKNLLIIDDEADYASVGFKKDKNQPDEVSVNTLATKIEKIRNFGVKTDFLQVTATPYSLYLQPEYFRVNEEIYKPFRPIFTTLVPIHDKYVGSDFYFEESENPNSPAFYLHVDVPDKELSVLGKQDLRYISNILTSPNLEIFRQAIISFIVAGAIRRVQEEPRNYKCSCIIHTETSRAKHSWQVQLAAALIDALKAEAEQNSQMFVKLVKKSYDQLRNSVPNEQLPRLSDVLHRVNTALRDGYIGTYKINSEGQVETLLDKKGQLRLDNPFNIFIGGQILDRGITVENLICFFYGRNPRKFQQDTVLQHSRMYGARAERDIAVTRLYTSARIYDAMKRMHELDAALREAFEKGQHGDDGVVFLEKDITGKVRPCSPNKILISSTETIRPYRRLLPRGMQTVSTTKMYPIDEKINEILSKYEFKEGEPFLIHWEEISEIFHLIRKSYEFDSKWSNSYYDWDPSYYTAILRRLCLGHNNKNNGKAYCIIKRDRNISRYKAHMTFNDAPDDGRTDRPQAKDVATELPCIQLFHQNGLAKNGWRDVPFWWPVLVCPKNTRTSIFTAETV